MKIIISPAKGMREDTEYPKFQNMPVFLQQTNKILEYIKALSYEDLKKLLACNDAIARLNYDRFQTMDLHNNLSAALLTYDGIQYKYMAPNVFEDKYFEYVQKHLRILSGFYGILKPLDGIVPYRLEMQAKFKTPFCNNLYDYWMDSIYSELVSSEVAAALPVEILNLASDEYSKVISKYLTDKVKFVTVSFGEIENGKVKEKGVYVKMARGEMVRYMAENNIENIGDIKSFDRLGYSYNHKLSTNEKYVFIK